MIGGGNGTRNLERPPRIFGETTQPYWLWGGEHLKVARFTHEQGV